MKKTDVLKSKVSVVDGKLILSLPTAKVPVVWQMDLAQAQSSAFTINENKKEKSFLLVLKSQNGEIEEIAPFEDKESAMEILMETSSALQNAHGNIKGAPASVQETLKSGQKGDKMGAILAILLIVVLMLIWMMSSSVPSKMSGGGSDSLSSSGSPSTAGVPVSAEDFLSNR